MKKCIHLLIFCCLCNFINAQTWDVIDKKMANWDTDDGLSTNKRWSFSTNSSLSGFTQWDVITQKDGYVNIAKMPTGFEGKYAFLVSPTLTIAKNTAYTVEIKARMNLIDKTIYPDQETPTASGTNGGYEANQLSIRMNGKLIPIYIQAGTSEKKGYVTYLSDLVPRESAKYTVNTSEWHIYRMLIYPDNTQFDVYMDDLPTPIFEGVSTSNKSGTSGFRIGAETYHRCNLDIEYVKMATGDYCTQPKVRSISVSSDSHIVGQDRIISVNATTASIHNGEEITVSLIDKYGNQMIDPLKAIVQNNQVTVTNFRFPSNLPLGKYQLKVGGANEQSSIVSQSVDYCVVADSPIETCILPQVAPVGFTIGINDYRYKPFSNEFIFPAVIDTKEQISGGKFSNGESPLDRYYLFYTPHENPGGMYLATAPSLDGPWTERNTVINLEWAHAIQGSIINTATHISSCQVIWNSIYNKYFMYFHGPNTTTHYATSDNLRDWTFGKSILNSQDFATRGSEASYAKVFEHKIPGLDNTYIVLLMIYEDGIRKIYWGHSKDGVEWICNKKPLISPDLAYKKIPGTDSKPSYSGGMGSNVSGPFFMENNGRYFVFFHGSSGNICVAEVGESLDMEVHWGEYMKAENVVIDKDEKGNLVALPRVASPFFIQDDNKKWYLFFEAGSRLGANIAFAKDISIGTGIKDKLTNADNSICPTVLQKNKLMTVVIPEKLLEINPRIEITNIAGYKVYETGITERETTIPVVLPCGVYILRGTTDDEPSIKAFKFIVK